MWKNDLRDFCLLGICPKKRLHPCCSSLCHSHETKQLGGNEHCFSLAFSLTIVSIFLHRIAQMRGIEYRLPRLFIYFCSSRTLVTINTQLFGMVNIWSGGACCGGSDQDLCHPHHHHHSSSLSSPSSSPLFTRPCLWRKGPSRRKAWCSCRRLGGDRYKVIRHITDICNQPDASQTSHTSKIESYQTHQTHAPTNTSQTAAESDIRRVILSDYYSPKIRNITSHRNWWGGSISNKLSNYQTWGGSITCSWGPLGPS